MKKTTLFSFLVTIFILNCATGPGEAFICHLYGWVKTASDSVGVNNLILQIRDINPYNTDYYRTRDSIITRTEDSLPGFFEIDSVGYGTTNQQGTGYVGIYLDSLQNPGWSSRYWYPTILGDVDTVTLYIKN